MSSKSAWTAAAATASPRSKKCAVNDCDSERVAEFRGYCRKHGSALSANSTTKLQTKLKAVESLRVDDAKPNSDAGSRSPAKSASPFMPTRFRYSASSAVAAADALSVSGADPSDVASQGDLELDEDELDEVLSLALTDDEAETPKAAAVKKSRNTLDVVKTPSKQTKRKKKKKKDRKRKQKGPKCLVADCGRSRDQYSTPPGYCKKHMQQARYHEAATKIKKLYKGFSQRRSFESLVVEKIMAEEEARERRDRERLQQVESMIQHIDKRETTRRQSLVMESDKFRMHTAILVIQYALRWRRKTRARRAARGQNRAKAASSSSSSSKATTTTTASASASASSSSAKRRSGTFSKSSSLLSFRSSASMSNLLSPDCLDTQQRPAGVAASPVIRSMPATRRFELPGGSHRRTGTLVRE